jgi:hypothetical protein
VTLLITGAICSVLSFLSGVVLTTYLRGYSAKKGENLATHEDISKLVDQVKAVTEATKKIEAEISTGVWDRQKRWEMKREVLFEAAKRLAEIEDALLGYSVVMKEDRKKQREWESAPPSDTEQLTWGQTKYERLMRWSRASSEFDESRSFVTIVCSKDSIRAFYEFSMFIRKLGGAMTEDPDIWDKSRVELSKKLVEAQMAIRKELGVDG